MAIPAASGNIYRIAETVDNQLRVIKQFIQAINDNEQVNHITSAYKHCVVGLNYFQSLTDNGIDLTKVGDAIALQFGNDDYASYAASYVALRDTKLPAFISLVDNNQSIIFDSYSLDPSNGELVYGVLEAGPRAAVMAQVTSILAEFS